LVYLFFRDELCNGDYDAVLPVEGKREMKFVLIGNFFQKTIPLDNSSA
jgi:hypothetical protein